MGLGPKAILRFLTSRRADDVAPLAKLSAARSVAPPADLAGLEDAIAAIYRLALRRKARPDELRDWIDKASSGEMGVAAIVSAIAGSQEAAAAGAAKAVCAGLTDGAFIQQAYDRLLLRGAMADEIAQWSFRLHQNAISRADLVSSLFETGLAEQSVAAAGEANDPSQALMLGTDRVVTIADWREAAGSPEPPRPLPSEGAPRAGPARRPGAASPRVTVIASMYRGGDFIAHFMDNITSQTIFERDVELIIVDAASPEKEHAVIAPFLRRFGNIRYLRTAERIGIYEAWNLGIAEARGEYITNANLDDARRADSLALQAATLDDNAFVDVVYQDVFYAFERNIDFDAIARRNLKSEMPIVTPCNLLRFNSPHNAPMWRRSIHADVGMFDPAYLSAGDWDFWLRCLIAGKTFFKINDPHVAYFVNPTGMSTRPDTPGAVEVATIRRRQAQGIVSPHLLSGDDAFLAEIARRMAPGEAAPAIARVADPHWRYEAAQEALLRLSAGDRAGASS